MPCTSRLQISNKGNLDEETQPEPLALQVEITQSWSCRASQMSEKQSKPRVIRSNVIAAWCWPQPPSVYSGIYSIRLGYRSNHIGLNFEIKRFFHGLCHSLSLFSLTMAVAISSNYSKYTSLVRLYLELNPCINLFLCWWIRFVRSMVTPMYKVVLWLFVMI